MKQRKPVMSSVRVSRPKIKQLADITKGLVLDKSTQEELARLFTVGKGKP